MSKPSKEHTQDKNVPVFHIIYEPWIHVRYLDGHETTLNIVDCLHDAKNIQCILCPGRVYVETYAIYRFLIALLVDAYKIRSQRQIKKLFYEGLDLHVLEQYVSDCEQQGISFNVFDKTRPFMQTPVDELPKNVKTVSVSSFCYGLKSGNDDIFYGIRQNIGDDAYMSIEEYIAMILTIHFCAVASGAGYSASVPTVGQPPIWFLSKGQNLYETLFLSMYPTVDDDVPMWRRKKYLNVVKDVKGWLSLAFYPVRFIAPGDDFDGKFVRNVKFGRIQFKNYTDSASHPADITSLWLKYEPFVATCTYTDAKDNEKNFYIPLKFKREKDMWMRTSELYGCTYENDSNKYHFTYPLILNTSRMFEEEEIFSTQSLYVLTLTTQTEKTPCQKLYEDFNEISDWMFDEELKEKIRHFISYTERSGRIFYDLIGKNDLLKLRDKEYKKYQKKIYDIVGQYFTEIFLQQIDSISLDDSLNHVKNQFLQIMQDIPSNDIVQKYSAYGKLKFSLNKLLKEYITIEGCVENGS